MTWVQFLVKSPIFTGCNEVVAKVMFLQVCVCPQGGGCLPQCMLGCQTPPRPGNPPDQADPPRHGRPPPGPGRPPWDQADTPRIRQTPHLGPGRHPPRTRQTPPPGKQTPAYGLRAAGTHPTGMHSCFGNFFLFNSSN